MKRFSPSFFIGHISIGTVEGASCVNLGNNLPSGFVNYKKQNQGFGSISGDNNDIHEIMATLEEEDIHDTFHYDGIEDDTSSQVLKQIENEMMGTEVDIEGQEEPE
ncbi:hypothetical protein [Bacillus sp. FJAT-27251]|uniref:hypothetical protein n=1 Tax=Bacillus sp. FJAT-27251 TaxID=1684142 RepID=UPI001E3377E0|nr:hypothetical protein [Bacillus sp. FJAT-27251]